MTDPSLVVLPTGHPLAAALTRPTYTIHYRNARNNQCRIVIGPSGEGWMDPNTPGNSDKEILDRAISEARNMAADKVVRSDGVWVWEKELDEDAGLLHGL